MSDGVLPKVNWEPLEGYEIRRVPPGRNKRITHERVAVARLLHPKLDFTAVVMLDPNDPDTQIHGLQKRLLRKLPSLGELWEGWQRGMADFPALRKHYGGMPRDRVDKQAGIMQRRLEGFVDLWLKKNMQPLSQEPDFYEWLERGSWTQNQKDQFKKMWEEKLAQSLPQVGRCRKVKPFVKAEAYPEFKACRWINASNDIFKLASGRWFWAMEEVMYDHTGVGPKNAAGQSWFIKHVAVPDRPALIRQLREFGNRYVSSDFTSFEASFTPMVMKALELKLYKFMLKNFPGVAAFLGKVLTGVRSGRTNAGVSFRRPGGRMSGDSCTSLGNGFSNLMLWSFWAQVTGKKICGYVEGDDGVFAVADIEPNQEPHLENPRDLFATVGFDVKAIWLDDPCDASFCGVLCSDDLQIIRDPTITINKFAWSLTNPEANPTLCMQLLRAKGMSLAYELPHCPVLRALANWALRETTGYTAVFKDRWKETAAYQAAAMKGAPVFAPTPATRVKFERLFGVSSQEQEFLERRIELGDVSVLEELAFSRPQAYARWNCVQLC